METFGASAPLKELQKRFGFTPENVVASGEASDRKAVNNAHICELIATAPGLLRTAPNF